MEVLSNRLISERYLVEGNRRQAGFTELWEAVDQQLERPVTIQILSESESANPQVCDTFLRHQRAASSIQDSMLFAVYDADVRGEHAYSVMQRITGMPASAVYRPGYPPDVALALAVTRQIAEVLQRCRQGGLSDWVFSPEAVYIDPEGDAHLAIIDGLAAPNRPGDIAGLSSLLRLTLTGNPAADNAQLRSAQLPEAVIALLDRLQPGRSDRIASTGEVASEISAIELASTQRTEAYEPGSMIPEKGNGYVANAAPDHTLDLAEAPTLVAPVIPASEIGAQEVSGQAARAPERSTMPLDAYAFPAGGERNSTQRNELAPWLLPVAALLVVLILGFVWLRLFSPATRVEGQAAVSPTSTPVAARSVLTNVTVPDLRGKSLDQATSMAQAVGLNLAPGVSDYNATYSAGEIVSQQPAPGEQVRAGSAITVNLSLGQAPQPTAAPKPPAPAPQPPNPPTKGKPKKGHK